MICDCIIKTLKNKSDKILWQAIYIKGKKELEDVEFDINYVNKKFNNSKEYKEIVVCETDDFEIDDFNDIKIIFPDEQDFTYLLDYRDIKKGDFVYLENGVFKIIETWNDIREAGYYSYKIWNDYPILEYKFEKMYYEKHNITKFKVEGLNKSFVWEDYNYQQSFLYLKQQEEINQF